MDFEQESDVIPVKINKDGRLSANSSVLTEEEFEVISEFVQNHIVDVGNEIYSGNIEAAPYVNGAVSSCGNCPYHSICGFDLRITGFRERRGAKLSKQDVLDRMITENALHRGKNN